jgi:Flp pilus assembly protein TadG
MELVFVLPIVLGLLFAMIEVGMLWAAGQRVDEAATGACRVASFRGADETAIRRQVENSLRRQSLVTSYSLNVQNPGPNPDEVCVTVTVPMKAAAPDLLAILGFGLGNRTISAQAVMRKE